MSRGKRGHLNLKNAFRTGPVEITTLGADRVGPTSHRPIAHAWKGLSLGSGKPKLSNTYELLNNSSIIYVEPKNSQWLSSRPLLVAHRDGLYKAEYSEGSCRLVVLKAFVGTLTISFPPMTIRGSNKL